MKRLSISTLQLIAVVLFGFFMSCSKNDENNEPDPQPPSINISSPDSDQLTVYPGKEVILSVDAQSNSNSGALLKTFTLTRTFADANAITEIDSVISTNSFLLQNVTIYANALNGQETWTCSVTDQNGESAEAAFTLNIEGVAPDFSPNMTLKTGTHSSGNPYVYEDVTLMINTAIAIGITGQSNQESNAELTHLKIERIYAQLSTSIAYDEDISGNSIDIDVTTITYPLIGDELWRIILTDADGEEKIDEFTITTNEGDPGIYIVNNITLGSYASAFTGQLDGDFGEIYTLTEANNDPSVQSKIDLSYYHGTVGGHTFMSRANDDLVTIFPSIGDWDTRRLTGIGKTTLGVTDFNQIENISQLTVFIQGQLISGGLDLSDNFYTENGSSPGGFEVGDIFAFETHANNYGLMRITEISESPNMGESYIKLDLKVEK